MTHFFKFEMDFVDSLRCIPMQVRMNLDTCGVKLKLAHWSQMTQEERQDLVSLPCNNPEESQAYKDFLQNLVTQKTGSPAGELPIDHNPPWLNGEIIPDAVQEKASEFQINISLQQWQNLTPLQRFALIKLSRPSHENYNFYPALQEFGMIERTPSSSSNPLTSEPFLWIHLAGIAAVPLLLQIVWLGLAVGQPLVPFWLELFLLVGLGIIPIFWMQWTRPFDIFSLLILAIAPNQLTADQQKILRLFKLPKQRILSAIAAILMTVILWQIYQFAPLAATVATFLPPWRILGLLIAAIALLLSNLFFQVPIAVLGVLLTRPEKFAEIQPISPEKISQNFTVFGFRVRKLLS